MAFVLPSFTGGGAERVILTVLRCLDRSRFHPVLVVLDAHGPLTDSVPADVLVHDLDRPRLRSALLAVARKLRELRPATVVSTIGYLNIGVLALRPFLPRGTRIVVREANLPLQALRGMPTTTSARCFYRWLYGKADAVICPAKAVARPMIAEHRIPPDRVHVIFNPVDIEALRAAANEPEREAGGGRRFVAAGRLHRQKGFDRLLTLFRELPADSRLLIMGVGHEHDSLCRQADDHGIGDRVTFAGFRAEPWSIMAGADAFLMPSRWEGMPNAALEALACGTPVIATPESGGIVEVAALAPHGAVTIAEAEPEFVSAMMAVEPSITARPRPSLLPKDFALDAVVHRYELLLA